MVQKKNYFTKDEKSRKEGAVANAITADSNKKMPLKENRTSRPQQAKNRKRRLQVPPKNSIVDGMREAAQLARNYMCETETHHRGHHHPGLPFSFSYEHLLNADVKLPQQVSLMSQLHTNGIVPAHLLNVDPGSTVINKRPFLADAAEESRMKRLRKLGNLTALEEFETLGYQRSMPPPAYGSNHNNSPLLPTPPGRPLGFFDFSNNDLDVQYFHKSQTAPYSADPPSPTPHSKGAMSKLNPEMRLDNSAFPSSGTLNLDATCDGLYDAKDNHQIKRPSYFSLSQQHMSANCKGSAESPRNSVLSFPGSNNLALSPLDGFLHPQNGSLTPSMFQGLANGDQKSQMLQSDAAYLGQIGQEVPIGLSQLNRQEVAAYLGHLAALRNLPEQHENSVNGQHKGAINRLNSLPSNPSAGILPLPGRLAFEGGQNNSNNNLISLGCFSPNAGILPLPGRSELSQMASLQRGIPAAAQGLNHGTPGQSLQFPMLSTQGDIASFQEELSCQRSVGGSRLQHHLQLMTKELSGERAMGGYHHLLSPLAFQNDFASSQQNPSAATAGGQHRILLQEELGALQQEVSAQRLQNSFLHPTSLSNNDLASLQHELLSQQRLSAGNPPLLQSLANQSNLALLKQDLAGHGLRRGYHPLMQSLPAQCARDHDLGALHRELDFQRLNCAARPLAQSTLQRHLSGPSFHGGPDDLFPTVHM